MVIVKVKRIPQQLSIPEGDFKASWQWFSRFRERHGLQKILLHGEGAEVDKEDPELLAALDDLYATISRYDPENVYNMDETCSFDFYQVTLCLCHSKISVQLEEKRKLKNACL